MGHYKPFTQICFTDTFSLFTGEQRGLFDEQNAKRIEAQQQKDIFIVISNPPYNAHQQNENDNNKNKKHDAIDIQIRQSYSKSSSATNKNALYDPYVKAICFGTKRIKDQGIVAYITNNSFLDSIAFDGMRKELYKNYNAIYIINLGGNLRKYKKGKTNNIFGIRVGVCISFMVKLPKKSAGCKLFYKELDDSKPINEIFDILNSYKTLDSIQWQELKPDKNGYWFQDDITKEYPSFLSTGNKQAKQASHEESSLFVQTPSLFKSYCRGISTSKDRWLYNFNKNILTGYATKLIKSYNSQLSGYESLSEKDKKNIGEHLNYDHKYIKWSRALIQHIQRLRKAKPFDDKLMVESIYRPFTKRFLYFDTHFIEMR